LLSTELGGFLLRSINYLRACIGRMAAHPETAMAKLKSAIIATVIWLACAVPVYGGFAACSAWLTSKPFATEAECQRALAYVQDREGDHGEYCAELQQGGWCAFEYDIGEGTDRCFMP
jgi:hypothetical protein